MKKIIQCIAVLLLSSAMYAQNNVNNPDPQNGEHGTDPSVNTHQTKDPVPMPDYPNGPPYPSSNPTDPYNPPQRDSMNESAVFNGYNVIPVAHSIHLYEVGSLQFIISQYSGLCALNSIGLNEESVCTNCSGSGRCKWCDGSGSKTCIDCHRSGESGNVKNADGTTTYFKCYRCSGNGTYNCSFCNTSGKCSFCSGTGISPNHGAQHISAAVKCDP